MYLLSWKKSLVMLFSFKSLPVKSRISRDLSEPNERGNELIWLWPSLRIRKWERKIIDAGNSLKKETNVNHRPSKENLIMYLNMIIR
jgi:hypothetical protein